MNVQPRTKHKKPRLDRTSREVSRHHVEEAGESWAVSYSDFLMVLLSFFILFFSTDDPKKQKSIIEQIALSVGTPLNKVSGTSDGNLNPGVASVRNPSSLHEISQILGPTAQFNVENTHSNLAIHFPENIFSPGNLDIKKAHLKGIEQLLTQLKTYRDGVNITVVGHSDNRQLQNSKSASIQNNFDLSSLRATRFLQRMVKEGFTPEQLSAKGTAEFGRNSRTLSLILEPKEIETP